MDDVDGAQLDPDRDAGGNDEFVARRQGGFAAVRQFDQFGGILEFEPPLIAGGHDLHRVTLLVLRHIVRIPDAPERGDGDDDQQAD